ncbi:MAG: hypothetical protein QXX94_03615 [Candidatus Bathyarchaeia archaeon]
MSRETLVALGKKAIGLTLIYNSIVSLLSSISILCGAYMGFSAGFISSPYSISSLPFLFVVLTSMLNIVPAKIIGKVNLRRILFHHYVYGILSIVVYFAFTILPFLTNKFIPSGYQAYLSLLLYWGLTLMIDDLADISPRIAHFLDRVKRKVKEMGESIQNVHLISNFISSYAVIQVLLWSFKEGFLLSYNPFLGTLHILLIANLLITALYGLKIYKEKIWLKKL